MIARAALESRAALLRAVRAHLDDAGFLEVETPVLFPASTFNPHIRELETAWVGEAGTRRLFLQTSPEHFMKRLLAGGAERIYQIARFFRNGEVGDAHNPEFTGLEFYAVGADYHAIMDVTQDLIVSVADAVCGALRMPRGDGTLDLTPPWPRITVAALFEQHAGIALGDCLEPAALAEAANVIGVPTAPDDDFDDVFFRIWLTRIEPRLDPGRPLFVHDYPIPMAIMAAPLPDSRWAQRVELFAGGLELANGFSELTDAAEQRRRFERDRALIRDARGQDLGALDEAFLEALERMPACAGIAIGLDRVLMLLTGATRIADVIAFPFRAE